MFMPSIFGESLLDDLFDLNKNHQMETKLYGDKAKNLMRVDIKENEHDFQLFVDLPGFKKEDLSIDLTDGYITISAKKTIEEEEKDKYIRKERFYGTISRSFYVGELIKKEDIKARFDNGVLTLTIPKIEPKEEKEDSNYIAIEG
ncbi:MAG: Hsp20/alpha crystallin family protein [Bacilli bacterium]